MRLLDFSLSLSLFIGFGEEFWALPHLPVDGRVYDGRWVRSEFWSKRLLFGWPAHLRHLFHFDYSMHCDRIWEKKERLLKSSMYEMYAALVAET